MSKKISEIGRDIEKGIKNGMIKNIKLCDKCGNYHRVDYDCAPYLEALRIHNEEKAKANL